jgi:hypothetical protein
VLYFEKQSDAGRVFAMVILIGIIIFAAVIGFYACFGRRINENIGSGFGKEYMKDKWGMDE